jgi:hypothetical protein
LRVAGNPHFRFSVAFLLAALALPAWVWAVDAFGYWRSPDRRPVVAAFNKLPRDLQVELALQGSSASGREDIIIGTSYVGRGIVACDLPLRKLWLPAMSLHEGLGMLQSAAREGNTVFVDVGMLLSLQPATRRDIPALGFLVHERVIQESVNGRLPSQPACGAEPRQSAPGFLAREQAQRLRRQYGNIDLVANARQFIWEAEPLCHERGLRIVFVLLPLMIAPDTREDLASVIRDAAVAISNALPSGKSACQPDFVDFASRELQGSNPALFSDVNHFKPELGRTIVAELLVGERQ